MPLKPHHTAPDKMVYVSRQYDMPDTPSARAYLDRVLDDDDIQIYKKPWIGLTHEELCKIIGVGTGDSDWNVTKVYDWLQKIEAALKEKNT